MTTLQIDEQSLEGQIIEQLRRLNPAQKQQVLDMAHRLSEQKMPVGMSGKEFVELVKSLNFDPEDVREMAQAIEEYCENIDPDDTPSADDW